MAVLNCTPLNTSPNFIFSTHHRSPSQLPFKVSCQKTETDKSITIQKSETEKSVAIKKLPPGPRKLPFIGNLHNLGGGLPHRVLKDLAKQYGPIMHLQLGEVPAIVVTLPELAQEVLRAKDDVVAQRTEIMASKILAYDSTNLIFGKGEYWKQMRKVCMTDLLGDKKVKSLAPLREDEAWNLLESMRSAGRAPINLSEKIYWMASVIGARTAFGNKWEDQNDVISLAKEGANLAGGFHLGDLYPKREFLHVVTNMKSRFEKMRVKLDAVLDRIVNEHKEKLLSGQIQPENEVLIDVLLRLQESGKLQCPVTIDNVKAVIWDMFAAGTDTSATVIEWALAEMIRNPKVLKKAQDEVREVVKGKETIQDEDLENLPYLKQVIKETLRIHPPVALLIPRESKQDIEIDGYFIPKNTKVIINAWAIGRDPAYWEDPESFKPERFYDNSIDFKGNNCAYIPFGGGQRICPGISLGLANAELSLAKLLYHFDYKLPNGVRGEDLDMTEVFGATVGRKNFLNVIATPYVPSN